MSEVILDENIENGEWPNEFSNAWLYVFFDYITSDTVAALFFDNDFNEGTVIEGYSKTLTIPNAYVSWKTNGECREIFVDPEYRNKGIGSKLCAWARSYCLNNENIIFHAPPYMTPDAQQMFQSISNKYGEEYTNPEYFPPTIPYGYWGGYLV